jgi:hypothetical protein
MQSLYGMNRDKEREKGQNPAEFRNVSHGFSSKNILNSLQPKEELWSKIYRNYKLYNIYFANKIYYNLPNCVQQVSS